MAETALAETALQKLLCLEKLQELTLQILQRKTIWLKLAEKKLKMQKKKLKEGLARLKEISEKLKEMGVEPGLKKNSDLIAALDTISLVLVGQAVLESALLRTESRAAHYRTDFQKTLPQ